MSVVHVALQLRMLQPHYDLCLLGFYSSKLDLLMLFQRMWRSDKWRKKEGCADWKAVIITVQTQPWPSLPFEIGAFLTAFITHRSTDLRKKKLFYLDRRKKAAFKVSFKGKQLQFRTFSRKQEEKLLPERSTSIINRWRLVFACQETENVFYDYKAYELPLHKSVVFPFSFL